MTQKIGFTNHLRGVCCRPGFRCSLVRTFALTLLFASVAVWSVWPMPQEMASQLMASQEGIATVPLFNAWTIAWNAMSLKRGMRNYWHAPIFHPVSDAFAFSEPQPASLIVAPVVWLLRSPILAYNIYMIISLILNGLFTVRLMRTLRMRWPATVVAGVAMMQHPLLLLQADVVQLMPIWGILWTLSALVRLRDAGIALGVKVSPQPANLQDSSGEISAAANNKTPNILMAGLETGVAFASVFATAVHHGLFLSLLLMISGLIIVPWKNLRQWAPGALTAMLVAGILIAPLVLPIMRVMKEHSFDRKEGLVAMLSIKPASFLVEPDSALIKCRIVPREGLWHMSPGTARTVLAFVSICLMAFSRFRGQCIVCLFLVLFGVAALLLSLGVNLHVGDWKVWTVVCDYVPGFSQVRNVFRFAYFYQLVVILLASTLVNQLLEFGRHWSSGIRWRRWTGFVLVGGLALLIAFEVPPPVVRLSGFRYPEATQWKTFVMSHLQAGNGILILPYAPGNSVENFDLTARWMVTLALDDIPMINGYSGFFPGSHFELQKQLQAHGLSGETLQLLSQSRVQFVVSHSQFLPQLPIARPGDITLATVFADSSGMQVLELRLPQ